MRRVLVLATVLAAACRPAATAEAPRAASAPNLTTIAEQSGYERTGRYDEVARLCRDFAIAYREVECAPIGETGERRSIWALHVHGMHAHAPATILIQAGIHAGEIEGKDAGFAAVRDLLAGKLAPGLLDRFDLVFVPVVNPDGHERFAENNRPNQRGPAEMGFRTNGARLNLNRDFVKLDSPEIRAIVATMASYDPLVFVDIHTTDGAKFEHDVSVNVAPVAARGDHLEVAAAELSRSMLARLTELGHLPVGFYPSFVKDDDPSSGFELGEAAPRFSQNYAALRDSFGILIENHSWRTYKERVASSYHTLQALFELALRDGDRWQTARAAAVAASRTLGGSELPVVFETSDHSVDIDFRGYAYTQTPSEISGSTRIEYDERTPQIWHVPLRDRVQAKTFAHVPRGGYVIDGGFARAISEILARHRIIAYPIAVDGPPRALDVFRATKVTPQPLFEGRTRLAIEGSWTRETRALDRGAVFVPIDQPNARLIVHLLDPAAPDSLAQWGELSAVFEQKEYMEAYVAEAEARAMLARDPKLREEWAAALAADPALVASPQRRLAWFYRRHPAWDERVNLLPIYRSDEPIAAAR